MLHPLVSIIIPYSVDRGYLNEAIESVKNQTYTNIELLIQNDNVNVSTNINNGIKRAKGEYIKYLCEDDYLTPNSITDSVKAIQGNDFIHGVSYNVKGRLIEKQTPRIKHPSLNEMLLSNVIHGGTLMYHRSVFDKIGLFDESLTCAEEYDVNLRCLANGLKLGYTDAILYNYRRHSAQKSLGQGVNQEARKQKIQAIKDKFTRLKIVCGIATFKGREETLRRTIESLNGQVDQIIIYDNSKNKDITDLGKFHGLKDNVYYFSCDDDIVYPSDYVQRTIEEIEKHKCIVTYHGRKLKGKGLNYYTGHESYSAFRNVFDTKFIDIAGTGVTAFNTNYFNPKDITSSEFMKMSDIVFSIEAKKQSKNIMLLPHSQGWINEQKTAINIHTEQSKNCNIQNKLIDENF
jgi:GT2 family glycosyltransferase